MSMKEERVGQGYFGSEQPTPNTCELSLASAARASSGHAMHLYHGNRGNNIQSAYAVLRLSFSPLFISLSFPVLSTFIFLMSLERMVFMVCKQTSWQVMQP